MRNRIYGFILEESKIRIMRKPHPELDMLRLKPQPRGSLWTSFFGFTQVCRTIRSELSPLFKAHTVAYVEPEDIYDYIETFLRVPATSDDQTVGSIILDFRGDDNPFFDSEIDVKPLLRLLRKAKGLYVGSDEIVADEAFANGTRSAPPHLVDILVRLYDIVDIEAFYDYVESAMTALVVESSESKGVEIIFELEPGHWEDWMGIWSKPDHDPHYRIPLEQADLVVEWGRMCGMELDRAAGSHLTVNFRRGG